VLDVGRPVLRRLTNLEYDYTVRDLLGLDAKARVSFQADELVGEFDVIGDGQSFKSDARYEQYFNSADALATAALADPTLRARVVTCTTTDAACLRTIATTFGLRAWRRPLATDEVDGLVALGNAAMTDGASFDGALQRVVAALLSSAPFLMRLELDPKPDSTVAHALTPYELASRLSYLLWSSMPDDKLFGLAADGSLLADAKLQAEVDRMLADPRADGFVEGFAVQWLHAASLMTTLFDLQVEAVLDQAMRDAMAAEMRLYAGAFMREDRDFSTFPSADLNFVNDRLASLYGMSLPGSTDALVRVTNTSDARTGFLGLAGFLTMTSVTGRSSPTARGEWIQKHLFCQTIPGPPQNTPDFIAPGRPETGRALVDSIHAQASCAACHDLMDGPGVALEAFDELGRFRTAYPDGTPVDTKGSLGGKTFDGEAQLASVVGANPRFLPCVSRELMSFAVNRTLGPSDEPYANQILTQWQGGTPTLRALIKAVVVSDTFKFRHGEAP
jgi:hypothetical protein